MNDDLRTRAKARIDQLVALRDSWLALDEEGDEKREEADEAFEDLQEAVLDSAPYLLSLAAAAVDGAAPDVADLEGLAKDAP